MIPTHTRTYGRAIHAPRGVRTHMILRRVIGCVRCLDEHTQHSETAWEEIWGHLGAVESRPVRTEMTAERLIARRAGPGKTGRRGRQDGLRRAHLWAVTARRGVGPACAKDAQLERALRGLHGSGAARLGGERISDQPPRALRLRAYEDLNCEAASPRAQPPVHPSNGCGVAKL